MLSQETVKTSTHYILPAQLLSEWFSDPSWIWSSFIFQNWTQVIPWLSIYFSCILKHLWQSFRSCHESKCFGCLSFWEKEFEICKFSSSHCSRQSYWRQSFQHLCRCTKCSKVSHWKHRTQCSKNSRSKVLKSAKSKYHTCRHQTQGISQCQKYATHTCFQALWIGSWYSLLRQIKKIKAEWSSRINSNCATILV